MHLEVSGDPWEQVRLLADRQRNEAVIELLRTRARGARVLEIGCGTGLLACAAARLGAKEVFAIETGPLWREAARLVRENGLDGIVEIIPGDVADLAPREVDFAFTQRFHADPFAEGLLEQLDAARRWLAPGGFLSPGRMRVWVALARSCNGARDARVALGQVKRIGAEFDLCVGALDGLVGSACARREVCFDVETAGPSALTIDLRLGRGERPENRMFEATADADGPVSGAVVWFEAELDGGVVIGNPPGRPGAWGHLVCHWPRERVVQAGERVPLLMTIEDGRIYVEPA